MELGPITRQDALMIDLGFQLEKSRAKLLHSLCGSSGSILVKTKENFSSNNGPSDRQHVDIFYTLTFSSSSTISLIARRSSLLYTTTYCHGSEGESFEWKWTNRVIHDKSSHFNVHTEHNAHCHYSLSTFCRMHHFRPN